eukprot:scpid75816/ scgid24433/ Collectin-46; 46 kDa collectin
MAPLRAGILQVVCLMAAVLVSVRAAPAEHPESKSQNCVVNMLATAGIDRHLARKYSRFLALAKVNPQDWVREPLKILEKAGITNVTDIEMIADCHSPLVDDLSRPEGCRNYQACDDNSECVMWTKSTGAAHFVCQTKDYCKEEPCLNGGICESTSDNFTCDCAIGYSGRHCEEKWLTKEHSDHQYADLKESVETTMGNMEKVVTSALRSLQGLMDAVYLSVAGINANIELSLLTPTTPPVPTTTPTTTPTTIPTTETVTTRRRIRVARTDIEMFVPLRVTWFTAKSRCEARGGTLAEARNSAEHHRLYTFLSARGRQSNTNFWLGGTDRHHEGRWRWLTGEAFSYTRWFAGEPNNDYAGHPENCLQLARGGWNDLPCDRPIDGYLCQVTRYSYRYV